MSVIKVDNLTRDYGSGRGIFDLSLAVEKGEVFGFLGPNGAGKTTTIRHLMGFIKPLQGSCFIEGYDCWKSSANIQKDLGYIPGEISFFDDMTGMEYLKFIEKYRGMSESKSMNDLIDRFELDANSKIKKMSKGTKQKIGIVSGFMHDPSILILDEPTSGLDPLMQNRFIELVIEEKNKGKTILMSSHMFEEVERTCHRVAIIRNGKLVAMDSVDALKEAQIKKYDITLDSVDSANAFAKENLEIESVVDNHIVVVVKNNIGDLISVMNKYAVTNITAPNQSLEEIFMQYYGGDKNV